MIRWNSFQLYGGIKEFRWWWLVTVCDDDVSLGDLLALSCDSQIFLRILYLRLLFTGMTFLHDGYLHLLRIKTLSHSTFLHRFVLLSCDCRYGVRFMGSEP